jgi:cathepsin X
LPDGRAERCSYNLTLGCHDVDLAHHEHYPLYTVAEYGGVSGADNMKAEILARGPISCGILTSASFENYSAGVLQLPQPPTQNAPLNHEVSIVGWGRDEHAGEYWDVRNSYGSAWGESGYARIKMHGTNGGLETRCSWGVPRVNTSVPGAVPNAESSSRSQPDVPQQAKVVPRGPQHRPPKSGLMRRTKPRRSVVVSPLPQDFIADEDVPAAYDVRNILGWDYSTTSRAQNEPHACGSCWAQGTVSSISDRMKLMRKAAFPEITLSVQVLLDCANGTTSWDTIQTGLDNDNCGGGEPDDVMAYLLNHGVPDDTCSSCK